MCNMKIGYRVLIKVYFDFKVLRIWSNEDVNLDRVFKATVSLYAF